MVLELYGCTDHGPRWTRDQPRAWAVGGAPRALPGVRLYRDRLTLVAHVVRCRCSVDHGGSWWAVGKVGRGCKTSISMVSREMKCHMVDLNTCPPRGEQHVTEGR